MLFSLLAQASVAVVRRVAPGRSGCRRFCSASPRSRRSGGSPRWSSGRARGDLAAALLLTVSYPPRLVLAERPRLHGAPLLQPPRDRPLSARASGGRHRGSGSRTRSSTALALFTHLTAAFTIAAHGLIWSSCSSRLAGAAVANRRRSAARALYPLVGACSRALGFLLYAPLRAPARAIRSTSTSGSESTFTKVPDWTSPRWTLRELIEGLGLGPVAIAAVVLVGSSLRPGSSRSRARAASPSSPWCCRGPIALAIFWGFRFHIWPRYFFPLLGPGLIFVVHGIDAIARAGRRATSASRAAAIVRHGLAIGSRRCRSFPNWRLAEAGLRGGAGFRRREPPPGRTGVDAGMAALSYRGSTRRTGPR